MALYGWHNCPIEVREQLDRLVSKLSGCLAKQLVGSYLHGSLAMGCFNPDRSDLDLLVVTAERMPVLTKRQIIEYLLACSQQPQPIKISFLSQAQLHPWRYPPPFDLHYSETWRAANVRDLAAGT
jgi:predicted nucleotidyltransferase